MMTMNLGMYQYGEAYYEEQPYYEEEYSPRYQYHADQYQEYPDQKQEYFQDVNVINGLSYTNLDYQYRCPDRQQEYEPCLEYGQQELQFQPVKEEHMFSGSEQHRLQPVQPAPSIPTYKWMQVKRNVPKPAGE
nr:drebrin-like protein [Halyomorpha halys]